MQLHYRQKENGMYILSREDIEEISTDVLKDYAPGNLERPTALNTREFLEGYLGLVLKHHYIGTFDSGILGMIVMTDFAKIPSCDLLYRPIVLEETYGTVLINPDLSSYTNIPRRRYTEVHEAAHFLLHKPYFQSREKEQLEFSSGIACRKVELPKTYLKTNEQWREWQADTLAAALLMPEDVFYDTARTAIRKVGFSNGYLEIGLRDSREKARDVISWLASVFRVSRTAVEIRLQQLCLIRRVAVI